MIKSTISGVDKLKKKLRDIVKSVDAPTILVGYHNDATSPKEGMTMAYLAAIHEFGANINHPGGTNYGYATKEAASKGQVRFLAAGSGYMVLGQTKPHKIKIPPRPSLKPGVNSGIEDYVSILTDGVNDTLQKGKDIRKPLQQVGVMAVGKVQEYMTNLKTPANAASTIRKKGRGNPLIDTGLMRGSVNYKLTAEKVEEGL